MHAELIDTALKLACWVDGRAPTQADLRRAISTAYYAIFQFTAQTSAALLAGGKDRQMKRAETQVRRSLAHRDIITACGLAAAPSMGFPKAPRCFKWVA